MADSRIPPSWVENFYHVDANGIECGPFSSYAEATEDGFDRLPSFEIRKRFEKETV